MVGLIIIPQTRNRTVECVMLDGKRFCENQPLDKSSAVLMGGLTLYMLLAGFLFILGMESDRDWMVFAAGAMAVVPFLLGALSLLIWGLL